MGNKMVKTKEQKVNKKHDPQAESTRATFGEPKAKIHDKHDFKI